MLLSFYRILEGVCALDELSNIMNEAIFNVEARGQIEELLGIEAYRGALGDFAKEFDAALPRWSTESELGAKIALVHKLSGAAAMLGMLPLHQKLLAAEKAGKAAALSDFERLLSEIISDWPKLRAVLLAQ